MNTGDVVVNEFGLVIARADHAGCSYQLIDACGEDGELYRLVGREGSKPARIIGESSDYAVVLASFRIASDGGKAARAARRAGEARVYAG